MAIAICSAFGATEAVEMAGPSLRDALAGLVDGSFTRERGRPADKTQMSGRG
jgi:hypothetical protein